MSPKSEDTRRTDAAWQKLVLFTYGKKCEVCEGTWEVSGHHIIHKSQCRGKLQRLRTDPRNGVVLCCKCHIPFAHEHQKDFIEWMKHNLPVRWTWIKEQTEC